MYRQLIPRIRQIKPQKVCCFCTRTHTTAQNQKWKLATAVCLQRYPVITQEMNEPEKKFYDMRMKMEIENSLLSEHEDQKRRDQLKAEQKNKELDDVDVLTTETEMQTALDKEDMWDTEFKAYTIPSRKPVPDDNYKSVKRKLDRKLVLIIQQKIGGKPIWILPQGFYNKEDTLKQAAESVIQTCCGPDLKSSILSNAPSGMYQYKLPKSVAEEENAPGVKIFIYNAEFKGGNIKFKDNEVLDYKWVTVDELSDYLYPEYEKELKKIVLEL